MGSRRFRNASCEATGIYLTEHTFLIRSSRSLATQRQESAHIPANAGLKGCAKRFPGEGQVRTMGHFAARTNEKTAVTTLRPTRHPTHRTIPAHPPKNGRT